MVSIKSLLFFLLFIFVVLSQFGSVTSKEHSIESVIFWSTWVIAFVMYYLLAIY